MRSDVETLREIVAGFPDPATPPTSDGLAERRPRRPLAALASTPIEQAGPYPRDLRMSLERRSSTTDYGAEPIEAAALFADIAAALDEDVATWGEEAAVGSLEIFVLLLRPSGAEPGIYRISAQPGGDDGAPHAVERLRPLPSPEEVEGMAVQKEFARAGAIISAAASLDEADSWGGAHGYRFVMGRAAALIYSLHLRSIARGLAGTVFAGFSTSAVRHLLDSDGVSRHQMFAVTVASPPG